VLISESAAAAVATGFVDLWTWTIYVSWAMIVANSLRRKRRRGMVMRA
jgi:hypothetical protein